MKNIIIVLLFIPSLSLGGLFGPDSFIECKKEYSENVKTELGATHIAKACNYLFKKNPTSIQKKFAKCLIKETPKQTTKNGQLSVIRYCRDKYNPD